MRVNKYRAVSVKSVAAQRDRALLTVREQLRRQSLDTRNVVWSILQVEGLKPPKLTSPAFQALVVQSLDDEALAPLLRPLVAVVEHLDSQVAGLDKVIAARAKASAACKRLVTVPGVGPLVALTYAAGVDDPARFSDSRNVGAHFGLTPRRFQSGEMDWSGGISRAGDAGVRRALCHAANVLIHHSRGWCALKSWAVRGAKRRSLSKAKVALARKLAVVLHKMWTTGEDYRLKAEPSRHTGSAARQARPERSPRGRGWGECAATLWRPAPALCRNQTPPMRKAPPSSCPYPILSRRFRMSS